MIQVLFIDDDANLARVVCQLCERYGGVSMHPVSSGREALEWLSCHPASVIVTDYQMPGMNGIEFIKKLRAQGNLAPCIMFTGIKIDSVIQESARQGVGIFGYIMKDDPIQSQVPALMDLIAQAAVHDPGGNLSSSCSV